MNPAVLADLVRAAAVEVLADRGLDSTVLPETVRLQRPRNPAHGDYATSIALQVGKQIGVPPNDLARWLADALTAGDLQAEAAEPGFVNVRLSSAALSRIVLDVEAAGVSTGPPVIGAWSKIAPDLRERHTRENPVFNVRYAHARTCRVLANAGDFGMRADGADLALLTHEREGAVIRTLGEFPGDPDRAATYLEDLADAVHGWYDTTECRILPKGDEEVAPVHLARLRLARAVRQVLVNGLEMLGVSAPERM